MLSSDLSARCLPLVRADLARQRAALTGSSALALLKSLPVDELKIDKSFVMAMEHSAEDAVIVRSTTELAQRLGLRVVAEGVETAAALEYLECTGCEEAQGYFLQRPVPAAEIAPWIEAWHVRRAGTTRAT
jgi:EAL domain-containing protein (putative c-di-GMP-specific phosphodiesterase class I)